MNALQILSSQSWVERLGWTLVHFLWQGLSIAVLYAAVRRRVARRSSPNARYLLACAALAAMMIAPLATWGFMRPPDADPFAAYRVLMAHPAASTTGIAATTSLPASVRATVSGVQPAQFLLWVVMFWLAGAAAFWIRLAGGWVVDARMRSVLVRRAPPEWQEALGKLGARIGLSRPVRLLVSALVQVPTVVGWLRPVVLVPVGALGGLPAGHLEALLLHELEHIRRHDYLVNILQGVAEALLFYHPAVWWVSGHIRAERELCCDDAAVSVTGDVLTYARALAELESYRPAHYYAAVAADGGSLAGRIARLLGQSRPVAPLGLGPGVLAVALLLAVAAYGLFAQSDAPPAFQAASIRRNTTSSPGVSVRPQPGGRLTTENAPVALLIQFAYSVLGFQMVGGPAWIESEGYDIEAKPEGYADRKHMWMMLQTLLADRFKLAVHRETRELPAYVLTASKTGLKLPPPKDCVARAPDAPAPPPALLPGQSYCGGFGVAMLPSGRRMQASRISMAEFAHDLARMLGKPVLDQTGFAGEFDVHLDYAPDEPAMGMPRPLSPPDSVSPAAPPGQGGPDIFAALQEQLGLKLVSAKGPVEVLVIDHVERPTAN